ncbi:MAG: hypothetical protein QG637_1571, partial [Chloroflexota bacterium]|nr:hypothetical protein [Chloroflexota bacterium]
MKRNPQPNASAPAHAVWPGVARGALAVVSCVAVGLTVAGIPLRYADLARNPYELTPGQPSAGFTRFVASYLLALEMLLALAFFAIAFILVARKGRDFLALFLALVLIALGATETGMTDALINPDYGTAWLAWRWPVWTLRGLSVTCALIMLYVLPDGRFVPGWTAALAAIWALLNLLWLVFPNLPFNTVYGPTWRATPVGSFLV